MKQINWLDNPHCQYYCCDSHIGTTCDSLLTSSSPLKALQGTQYPYNVQFVYLKILEKIPGGNQARYGSSETDKQFFMRKAGIIGKV